MLVVALMLASWTTPGWGSLYCGRSWKRFSKGGATPRPHAGCIEGMFLLIARALGSPDLAISQGTSLFLCVWRGIPR